MKKPKYIQLEGLEVNKNQLNRPDVQVELLKQLGNKVFNSEYYFLGIITHSFEDTQLPMELDYVFQSKNTNFSENVKFTIRGCFNYGDKFHTKLWQGYNHLAIFEIDKLDSKILQTIKPYKNRMRWDPVLILCESSESETCKESIKSSLKRCEDFMKANNLEHWKFLKQEEEEYKRTNK